MRIQRCPDCFCDLGHEIGGLCLACWSIENKQDGFKAHGDFMKLREEIKEADKVQDKRSVREIWRDWLDGKGGK